MKEYLPIGSVVLINGIERKIAIMGIMQRNGENPEKEYDYIGVPYPEGYLGDGTAILFDHSAINDVIFRGYTNPERDALLSLIRMATTDEATDAIKEEIKKYLEQQMTLE